MMPLNFEQRCARAAAYANAGNPTALIIANEDERLEAQRLVGNAPVIVATGPQLMDFLCRWPTPHQPTGNGASCSRRGRRR
jgi:hypothetical protein